jgi:hypothetical protein
MITAGLFMLLFSNDVVAQDCDELKRDMKALELFLQDKKDYEEYCPKLDWEQPSIEIYKSTLKSQLPEECKND